MLMFNKVKQVLDCPLLHILYCSLVLSYLNYCDDTRGNHLNIHFPFILQRKAFWIIYCATYRDHNDLLFLQLELLKFADLVREKRSFTEKNVMKKKVFKICSVLEKEINIVRSFCNLKAVIVSVCGWNSSNEEWRNVQP